MKKAKKPLKTVSLLLVLYNKSDFLLQTFAQK